MSGDDADKDNVSYAEIINNAALYYKVLYRCVRERNKICELFSIYFEDVVGIEADIFP